MRLDPRLRGRCARTPPPLSKRRPAQLPGTTTISVVEPLYGFLPGPVQERFAREAGYQALLYTKISILLSAAVGVLLAGSWEPVSAFEPAPPEAAVRVLVGLFLIAESIDRYLFFAKGRPTGSLIVSLLYGALAPLGRLGRG